MSRRDDHAALAAQMARDALDTSRSGAQVIAGVLAATAQAHATLALVEQQRIANEITLATLTYELEDAHDAIGQRALMALPGIAAALGIKAVDHD